MKTTKIWPVLLVLSVTVSLFSCGNSKKPIKPRVAHGGIHLGGELNLSVSTIPNSLNPLDMNGPQSVFIGSMIHATLLKNEVNGNGLVPEIAERWEQDVTETILLFHLRKDIKFHETNCLVGKDRAVLAKDVVSSFEKLCAPGNESAFLKSFRNQINGAEAYHLGKTTNVAGLEALDDYSVRITLTKPNGSFPFMLTEPICAIVAYCEDGESAGSGPFIAKYFNDSLVLFAHPEYGIQDEFGNNLPYLDRINLIENETKQQELDAFFDGQLDVVSDIHPDPIRNILDQHIHEFSGKNAIYIMKRSSNLATYDLYTLYRKGVINYSKNFLDRANVARVQLKRRD